VDTPHDRAIDALTIALGLPRRPGDAVADAVPDVLVAAGWIDAAEAAAWRARLLAREVTPEAPATHAEAAAILDEARGADWDRREALLDALADVGALSEDDAARFEDELWDEDDDEDAPVEAGQALAAEPELSVELSVELEPAGAPSPAEWRLVRVVPGPPERVDGWRVTAACVYDGGISIWWHAESPVRPSVTAVPTGAAVDDRGVAYAVCRARFDAHVGEWTFTPAPPVGARHLDVTLDGRDFRIAL
jgi:hypothetical protein